MLKLMNNNLIESNRSHIKISNNFDITNNLIYCYNILINKKEVIGFNDNLLRYNKGILSFN